MGILIEQIGMTEMLNQTAEEASELSQACLKLSRKIRGINYTPKTKQELIDNLYEEIADVEICIEELKSEISKEEIEKWKEIKRSKVKARINKITKL